MILRNAVLAFLFATICRLEIRAEEPSDEANASTALAERALTAAERNHWAYRPIADKKPPDIADSTWNAHPVDRFIASEFHARGLHPLLRAGRSTLLRRVTLDLTGLLPTPDELEAFVADARPDAWERVIDRLLASPAYGERYAQHWLDLARFAETDGFEHDLLRPNAWRYRDWVINALNRDLPYDEFLRLQLAGDELHPHDPQAAVATGFLLAGPDMPDVNQQDERRHLLLNEMTSTVGAVFLGMQVGCAQCHDHKFDAITIHDFYRLRAFFESGDIFQEHAIPTPQERAARESAETAWTPADRDGDRRRKELEERARRLFREKNPDERPTLSQALGELTTDERAEHTALAARMAAAPKLPKLPRGRVFRSGKARAGKVYLRGDYRRPGPEIDCGFPRVLAENADGACDSPASVGGTADVRQRRAALADWLASPENPLTARVIVNRVWQWHFGRGLSGSPSDFGVMGEEPSHPELLDWLARWFVRDGWSLKRLHKLLLTSQTYCLAAHAQDPAWSEVELSVAQRRWNANRSIDAENRWQWRRRRGRLDGETLRDCMLAAGGALSSRRGGPGVRPPLPPEVTSTLLRDQWRVTENSEDHRRRSVYLFVRRNLRYPLFDVFDRPDTNASCPARHESTTATQSLTLLNSAFSLEAAQRLAGRLLIETPEAAAGDKLAIQNLVNRAYRTLFVRPPSVAEALHASDFVDSQRKLIRMENRTAESLALPKGAALGNSPNHDLQVGSAAIVQLCLALFNASEFVYVD